MNARALVPSLAAALVALSLTAAPASAQKPPATGETMTVHPEAKAAIDRIESPYCPGMMLEVCTSAGGAMLRDSIERMAEAGLSADSIVELVIAEYGEEWRALPKRAGLGLWAWVIPPVVLVGGLMVVAVVLGRRRRMAGEAPQAEPAAPEATPADEARLKAALKELDEEEEPVF